MKSTATSALELEVTLYLSPLHLYMKSEAKIMNFKTSVDERQENIRKLSDEVLNKEQAKDLT